jgi:predicted HNH restriction endonuclease
LIYLQAHHIIPFEMFGIARYEEANQLSNLMTLCIGCHKMVHSGRIPLPS